MNFEQPKYDLSEDVINSEDFNRPRFFSMKQIRNLFYYHQARSNVGEGVDIDPTINELVEWADEHEQGVNRGAQDIFE